MEEVDLTLLNISVGFTLMKSLVIHIKLWLKIINTRCDAVKLGSKDISELFFI